MAALADMKNDLRALALKAHEIVENDDMTSAEKREALDKYDADIKSLSEQVHNEEYLAEQRKSLGDIIGAGADTSEEAPAEGDGSTLGDQLIETETFKSLRSQLNSGMRLALPGIELKGTTFTESGLTSANVVAQDRQPGIVGILFQRLTIQDLIPATATSSNVVRYVKESTATNAASTVAEGGTKPEGAFNFDVVDEPVRKVAVYQKVTNEIFDDFDAARQWVDSRLTFFVGVREEQQILTGNGTAPDLTGILNRSGLTAAQAKSSDTIAVATHKELTKIRNAFIEPDTFVFHPNDWEAARLEQDQNLQFYGGGPFTGPYGVNGIAGDTYWGKRVVVTTAMTENTVLLGNFQMGAKIWRRQGITLDFTNSDQDDFIKNLVTVRAESRLALGLLYPAAFGTITGV